MFATYNCWCIVVMVVHMISGVVGVIFMRKLGWIVCSRDGSRWIIINDRGSIFLSIHVVLLLLICVMTKILFGKTAMEVGLIPDKKKLEKEKKEAGNREMATQPGFGC